MYNNLLKISILLCFLNTFDCCGDHYWRDYEGVIPDDAIPAGRNSKGVSYIGQVYIHNYGILMGTIIPGKWEVEVPCYGVKKADSIIKILCAEDRNKYKWIPVTLADYSRDIGDQKCPIIGGYDQVASVNRNIPLGTLHIGRTTKHGDVIIGNIAIYDKKSPWFYYPLDGRETKLSEYEVLVYDDKINIDLEPRINNVDS